MDAPERALPRPRPVLDADHRLVGHVAELAVDPASGRVSELVLDLAPEAAEALLGPGSRRGILAVGAEDLAGEVRPEDADGAVRLLRNLGDMKQGFAASLDDDEDWP